MSKYYTPPATTKDGDIAYAADVNNINTEADTGFTLAYADISAMEGTVSAWAALAKKWAENPEDTEVTSGAYSAMHWALKSESFISDAQAYSIDSQNYSIAAAASASTAATEATSATASAVTATTKATASATSATSAATSATASEASAVRAESAAIDNASSITALTAVVSTNTGNISDNTYDISLHETRILANTADIASHDTRILANTSDITQNTSDIASHDTRILANASDIATNTSAIAVIESSSSEKILLWSGVAGNGETIDWTTTGRKLSEFDLVMTEFSSYSDGAVQSSKLLNIRRVQGVPDYSSIASFIIGLSVYSAGTNYTGVLENVADYSAYLQCRLDFTGSVEATVKLINLWGIRI